MARMAHGGKVACCGRRSSAEVANGPGHVHTGKGMREVSFSFKRAQKEYRLATVGNRRRRQTEAGRARQTEAAGGRRRRQTGAAG